MSPSLFSHSLTFKVYSQVATDRSFNDANIYDKRSLMTIGDDGQDIAVLRAGVEALHRRQEGCEWLNRPRQAAVCHRVVDDVV